jgi:hypothetical protein
MDELLLGGYLPLLRTSSFGTGFYIFYIPMYVIYDFFQRFGLSYNFLLISLFKIPPIIGNLIIFYSLYEILKIKTGSESTALKVSSFYFLNPYVIFMDSWVGHAEQLSVSFILLSFLFILKGHGGKSGAAFALSVFTRYIPILLFPAFSGYILINRRKNVFFRFLFYFIISSVILAIPYLLIFLRMYEFSPRMLLKFFAHFFHASTIKTVYSQRINIEEFMFNFTGFFSTLGLWKFIKFIYGLKSFLLIYMSVMIGILLFVYIKEKKMTVNTFIVFPILLYSFFIVFIPLSQHHYLSWLLPFLFLTRGLSMIPGYLITILWISNLLIDPITGGGYKYAFGATFSDPFSDKSKPLLNVPLQQALSGLMGFTIILIVYFCLKSLKDDQSPYPEDVKINDYGKFYVLFLIFGIVEIFKIVYNPILYKNWFSLLFGIFVLLEFFHTMEKDYKIFTFIGMPLPQKFYLFSITMVSIPILIIYFNFIFLFLVLIIINGISWNSNSIIYIKSLILSNIFLFISISYFVLYIKEIYILPLYLLFMVSWVLSQMRLGAKFLSLRSSALEIERERLLRANL